MSFIFAAAYTDQSLLGTMEPVYDILAGNTAAIKRWGSQMTNALFPLGSFRNELGKNLFGMLREVENDDFGEMMRNKNNWLDVIDPLGKQPDLIENPYGTTINHFMYYLYVSLLGFFLYLRTESFKKLVYVLFFFSIILEILHLIVPNRSFQLSDLLGNILGVVVAYFVVKIYQLFNKQ